MLVVIKQLGTVAFTIFTDGLCNIDTLFIEVGCKQDVACNDYISVDECIKLHLKLYMIV